MNARPSPLPMPGGEFETRTSAFAQVSTLAQEKRDLEETNRRLMLEIQRLERLVYEDALTGLGNRRRFDAVLESELARAARSGASLTVLICDVDRFKHCNDTYGHMAGDGVLIEVAGVLRRFCRRGGDLAARYAGDEFALLLPGLTREDAEPFADHLRTTVSELSIRSGEDRTPESVTISVGGATFRSTEAWRPAELVAAADEALYRAKAAGRNLTVFAA